jgi:hypothetical protein
MSMFDKIKTAVDSFGDAIKDIVTLDVVTLTGEVTVKPEDGSQEIDLQELYKTIEKKAAVDGVLELVAFTHVDLDADSINFVKRDLAEEQRALLIAHHEAVKAAQETRAGVVAMIRSFF